MNQQTNKVERVKLSAYYVMLKEHDWYYAFSDCFDVMERGDVEIAKLRAIADRHPVAMQMFKAFYNHSFSGECWGQRSSARTNTGRMLGYGSSL